MSTLSDAEVALDWQLRSTGLVDGVVLEHAFHPTRRWRFDFAWPERRVAVEVEGGHWIGGHGGARFEGDAEKYNEAALLGWIVLRVSPRQVRDGVAIAWVERALRLTQNRCE